MDEATLDELCDERVSLLFYHRPSGCPHCNYEKPQISAFERKHPEVAVTWRSAGSQSGAEQSLLAGTSGHPIMVLHVADHKRVLVGETSADELDRELATFLREIKTAQQRGTKVEQRTTLGGTCH